MGILDHIKEILEKLKEITLLRYLLVFLQIIQFGLSITFIDKLNENEQDYYMQFEENQGDLLFGLAIIGSLLYSYRLTIVLFYHMLILIFSVFMLLPILCGCIFLSPCCAKIREPTKCLCKYAFQINLKFLFGTLDFLHLFTCCRDSIPDLFDYLQPIFDVLSLLLDFSIFVSVFVAGFVVNSRRKLNGNSTPVVIYFLQSIPLLPILIINFIHFNRNLRVSARVRDIFKPNKSMSKQAKAVYYEDAIGSRSCMFAQNCLKPDPEHRIRYHKQDHVFKLKEFNESGIGNIVIGFHQTSIENVKLIIENIMRPSKEGWLGSGIYFANNIKATFTKANNNGAIIVAQINLGRVEEVFNYLESKSAIKISDGYQTRYLHHKEKYNDEFIIRDYKQIKEYLVVVLKDEVKKYRTNNKISPI
jgi:hypothetical protein